MKYIIFLFIFSWRSFSCEIPQFQLPPSVASLYFRQISPVVKSILHEEATKNRINNINQKIKYTIVEVYEPDIKVFGYTEKEVMDYVSDPNGHACSTQHIHGDLANRWCHAMIVKIIDETLKSYDINKFASGILAASVFLPKEYLIDLHPSKADLVISDFKVFQNKDSKNSSSATVTVFGDGMIFINFKTSLK